MKSDRIQKLTLAGALAALTAVATLLIQIPSPTKGYINTGDVLVNLSAWVLGPLYGSAAAGIGSALADLISGYTVYAPATLIIKAGMAAVSYFVYKRLSGKRKSFWALLAGAAAAETVMIFATRCLRGCCTALFPRHCCPFRRTSCRAYSARRFLSRCMRCSADMSRSCTCSDSFF